MSEYKIQSKRWRIGTLLLIACIKTCILKKITGTRMFRKTAGICPPLPKNYVSFNSVNLERRDTLSSKNCCRGLWLMKAFSVLYLFQTFWSLLVWWVCVITWYCSRFLLLRYDSNKYIHWKVQFKMYIIHSYWQVLQPKWCKWGGVCFRWIFFFKLIDLSYQYA